MSPHLQLLGWHVRGVAAMDVGLGSWLMSTIPTPWNTQIGHHFSREEEKAQSSKYHDIQNSKKGVHEDESCVLISNHGALNWW